MPPLAAWSQQPASVASFPAVFPYGWPGYAMTAVAITGAQQIRDEGEQLLQIEQPKDIASKPTGTMLSCQVLAAVRLQAAARGFLVRRHARDLQLQLLQVPLRGAKDLALVRCVGALGHAVSPTGGGHAVFSAGSNLKVCDIDSHPAGRRHGVTDRSAPRSTTAFRHRPPRRHLHWLLSRPIPLGGHPRAPLL